jgi:acyl-CoA thioester hydrolase
MARFGYDCHLRWSDMDAFAHINNTAYLTYLEQARIAMFFDQYDSTFAQGTVIARNEIDSLKPIVYHADPLRIEMWVGEIGAASFVVHYEILDRGVVAARAASTCVMFDFATERPRRLLDSERQLLAACNDDQVATDGTSVTAPRAGTATSGRVEAANQPR